MQMNNENVKAKITVCFKTCNLIDSEDFKNKYNANLNALLIDLLRQYPLKEIIDNDFEILKIDKF